MRMWVFRIPKAPGGDPDTRCPVSLNQEAIRTGLAGTVSHFTNYSGALDFVLQELFSHNRLRQGWGVPTLDLRLSENAWIENYIVAASRYWDDNSSCELASGRRRILISMTEMAQGDVVFLPSVGNRVKDDASFSVCTVSNLYFFEDRSLNTSTWEKDFGHVVPVCNLRTLPYSAATLKRSVFGAPYLHAIDEIKKAYASYPVLADFASRLGKS